VDEVRQIVMAAPVKSSSLDPVPTFLLRESIDVILPFLTVMVNASLRDDGCLPTSQKMAVVTPLLKKASLEPQDLKNYKQLMDYLETNGLLPSLQSAYRRHHSTE